MYRRYVLTGLGVCVQTVRTDFLRRDVYIMYILTGWGVSVQKVRNDLLQRDLYIMYVLTGWDLFRFRRDILTAFSVFMYIRYALIGWLPDRSIGWWIH